MTNSAASMRLPFLLRFARPIPKELSLPFRYDSARQVGQVLEDGQWIDTPDASEGFMASTRKTAVAQETLDDQ